MAVIAALLALNAYAITRIMSQKLDNSLIQLDSNLAKAITGLIQELPLDLEGVNPLQAFFMDALKQKMNPNPSLEVLERDDGGRFTNVDKPTT